jgi:uncharacterized protein (TIGR03083 family)
MTGAVRAFAEDYAGGGANRGIVRVTPARQLLVDQMVHHQDVRRPLGLAREIPGDRLRAALEAAPAVAGPVRAKKRAAGLRLEATDVDWSTGTGPVVRGTGEALLLALTGRQVALAELEGDGVAVLRQRCGA